MTTPPAFLTPARSAIAVRMLDVAWQTPLGAPATWPVELQTVVGVMLHAPTPMSLLWGPDLLMLYNDAFAPMIGDRHPGALGTQLALVWPELWPELEPPIRAALRGETIQFQNQEFLLDRGRGKEQAWFSFSYSAIHHQGRIGGLLCLASETTEQVLSRQKAAQEQDHLQQLFMQMPGMVGVVRGPEHVFEIANHALRALYGHRPLVGRTVSEALPELAGQGFSELLDRVFETGVAHEGKATPALLPSADGQGLERRYFDFTYQPIVDAAGAVTGIFSQGLDVTEATLATLKLQESEAWFRLMADAVPQIIWITDREGRNEFFNRQWAEYTGAEQFAVVTAGEVANQFLHPDDVAVTMARFEESIRSKTAFSVEHRIRRKDGVYRWFLVRAEPQVDPANGEVVRWFGSSTDISALKDAEAALQLADRRKDEFLATLSHELRNPLAPIMTALTILRSPKVTDDVRRRMLDMMDRQARHLVHVVNDLLEVSRITRGKIELKFERIDLRSAAQACLDAAAGAIQEAQHKVALRVPGHAVWVHADAARIKQVIDNLLNNAIKYTPQGGSIELEVSLQGEGAACIEVRDDGAGIPPDMLESVFDLFAQVDHTVGRARGGLGIGLALVKQLVHLHGGNVGARSAGIGAGATFTVCLPLAVAAAAGPATEPEPGLTKTTTRPKRVLVIDDNRDAADSLASAITLCGHTAETAFDGPSGLAAAQSLRPDCVLLDIGMPGMDGHEVARRLRRMDATCEGLIVAVTGWGQAKDRDQTLEAGFDAHLVKPVSIDAVLGLLERGDAARAG